MSSVMALRLIPSSGWICDSSVRVAVSCEPRKEDRCSIGGARGKLREHEAQLQLEPEADGSDESTSSSSLLEEFAAGGWCEECACSRPPPGRRGTRATGGARTGGRVD